MRRPLARTVHAPHCPWSQPFFVPVRWRFSRRRSSRVVRGSSVSCSCFPLMVSRSGMAVAWSAACSTSVTVAPLPRMGKPMTAPPVRRPAPATNSRRLTDQRWMGRSCCSFVLRGFTVPPCLCALTLLQQILDAGVMRGDNRELTHVFHSFLLFKSSLCISRFLDNLHAIYMRDGKQSDPITFNRY